MLILEKGSSTQSNLAKYYLVKIVDDDDTASAMVKVNNSSAQVLLTSGRTKTQLVQWWDSGGSHKKYVACSVALLKDDDGNEYHLVWPHNYSAKIDLTWASQNKEIIFEKIKGVKHVALLCSCKKTVLTHWITGNRPGQKPTRFDVNDSCPDEGGGKPEPDEDPLQIAENGGANWMGTNVYVVGETVEAKSAMFTGGLEPITYRYRFQMKEEGESSWVNTDWTETTNAKNSHFYELTAPGRVKFQSQAKDSSEAVLFIPIYSNTAEKTVT